MCDMFRERYVQLSSTIPFILIMLQWTVGGSKNKKKGKAGKVEKKGAMKKQMNKAASSGSSDKESSSESSAPEEGKRLPCDRKGHSIFLGSDQIIMILLKGQVGVLDTFLNYCRY